MNTNMKELNPEEMEQVSGGRWCSVNTGRPGQDLKLLAEPRGGAKVIGHIPNGKQVDTISDPVFDSDSRRHYIQVGYEGRIGWVQTSAIGLPR